LESELGFEIENLAVRNIRNGTVPLYIPYSHHTSRSTLVGWSPPQAHPCPSLFYGWSLDFSPVDEGGSHLYCSSVFFIMVLILTSLGFVCHQLGWTDVINYHFLSIVPD